MTPIDHRASLEQNLRTVAIRLSIIQPRIRNLPQIVREFGTTEIDSLHTLYASEDLSVDYDYWEDLVSIAEQLALVELYHLIERETVRLMSFVCGSRRARQLYKVDTLRKTLKQDFQVELDSLPGFRAVDRLRGLCNAVKHGGMSRRTRYRRKFQTALAVLPQSTYCYLEALTEAVAGRPEAALTSA